MLITTTNSQGINSETPEPYTWIHPKPSAASQNKREPPHPQHKSVNHQCHEINKNNRGYLKAPSNEKSQQELEGKQEEKKKKNQDNAISSNGSVEAVKTHPEMLPITQILPSPPLLPLRSRRASHHHRRRRPNPPPDAAPSLPLSSKSQRPHLSLRLRCCSSSPPPEPADDTVELPLFPLPLVLFPGAILPLQIFEFRYRIMLHTLLHTDLRFGVIFSDGDAVAPVGCVGEVVKHERLVDDRFFLICKGQERFRVLNLTRTRPYLVARVAWLEDRPSPPSSTPVADDQDIETLASDVEGYMRDVIRISNRLNGKEPKEDTEAMDLRRNLFPTPFSFFVGSTFEGAPREQQALLELEDTSARLRRERDTLRNTLNYLTAASAVKDAFPSSPSSS